jgi:hypothetical protein
MIVDDDGGHLRGRQVWVVEGPNKPEMVACRKGLGKEHLFSTGRKKDHGFPQVGYDDTTAVIESPPVANRCRDRHLPAGGDEIVR